MNKVILVGRTTRDVEVKHGDNESIFARFTLAVDRRFKKLEDEQTADLQSKKMQVAGEKKKETKRDGKKSETVI